MSSEWPYLRIGEIGKVTTGKTPSTSKPENFDGVFPFITIPDLGQGRDILHTARSISDIGAAVLGNTKIPAKAVLMSCIATIGKTGITTKPSFTNQQINSVVCGTGVIPEFLYYVFCQLGPEIEAAGGGGSVFTNVSKSKFNDVRVPVPPLPVQRNIVNFLTPIDDRITLLRETNTTLEAIAQALFKSWFVDFDPVHAKMQGRTPEGMDEVTAALFPDSFEESELGAVPKGWQVMSVGDAVETVGGATPDTKTPEYWEPAEHHWTTPKDLSGIASPVLLGTERKLSDAGLKKISSGLLPVGSLLMSSRAPIGYLAMTQVPMAINQGYIAILPDGKLSPLYMLFWCQTNMDSIKGRANG